MPLRAGRFTARTATWEGVTGAMPDVCEPMSRIPRRRGSHGMLTSGCRDVGHAKLHGALARTGARTTTLDTVTGDDEADSILLVEDDTAIREGVRELLREAGHPVVSVSNGALALERLRSGLRPRLILLDLNMPVLDGWSFIQLRGEDARLAEIPVVVLSAVAGPSRSAPYVGVSAILAKPLDVAQLFEVIDLYARPAR